MAIDVTVLRVFTDQDGNFGNPLGVVDASQAEPGERQRIAAQLGYSETIFIDLPGSGAHRPSRSANGVCSRPSLRVTWADSAPTRFSV